MIVTSDAAREKARLGPTTDLAIRKAARYLVDVDPIMKRLDVLAVGDAGLQRAAGLLYGKKRKSKTLLPRVAEAWRPYRSVASWYL